MNDQPKLTVVPSRPQPFDAWQSQLVIATRILVRGVIPVQVILDTFLVYRNGGAPIDVRIERL